MTRIVIGAALSATLLTMIACGSSSPSSPSATSASPAIRSSVQPSTQPTSTVAGRSIAKFDEHEHGDDDHGQLEGTIASINAPGHSLMIGGKTVTVSPTTIIRHGHTTVAFGDLAVGERIHVKGAMSGSTIAATEIIVQDDGDNEDHEAEAEGAIAGLTGSCPALTFTVNGTKVTTNAATTFGHADCAQFVNGSKVKVRGTRQADGSILAARVSLVLDEAEGTVSGLTGACPALTFMLGTTKITTNASTTFGDGACAGVANGGEVEVKGVKQPDGSIVASRVSFEHKGDDDKD